MTIEIDFKILFSGLAFIVSLVSLWMASSARSEARETALLELVHQKRMLLSNQFSDVCRLVRILKDEQFDNKELIVTYDRLKEHRNRMINAMNESSESMIQINKLDKKFLLNEISDFNLMNAIHQSDILDLQEYLKERPTATTVSKASKTTMQPTADTPAKLRC